MSARIVVRRSGPADVKGLHAALDSVARERRYLAMVEAPARDDVAAFAGHPDVVQFAALDDDTVVGWADVRRMPLPGFTHRGTVGMGVVASHRARGLGTRLLSALIAACPALGVRRLELSVLRSNCAAIHLYERHGFVVEGEQPRARILDGVADDLLLMVRWLD